MAPGSSGRAGAPSRMGLSGVPWPRLRWRPHRVPATWPAPTPRARDLARSHAARPRPRPLPAARPRPRPLPRRVPATWPAPTPRARDLARSPPRARDLARSPPRARAGATSWCRSRSSQLQIRPGSGLARPDSHPASKRDRRTLPPRPVCRGRTCTASPSTGDDSSRAPIGQLCVRKRAVRTLSTSAPGQSVKHAHWVSSGGPSRRLSLTPARPGLTRPRPRPGLTRP